MESSPHSVAGEHGGAGGDGVGAEGGGDDLGGLEAGLEGAAASFADDGVQDQIARLHDAPAEDDAFNVEKIDDGGDGRADVAAGAFEHHQGEVVAVVGGVGDVGGGEVFVQAEAREGRGAVAHQTLVRAANDVGRRGDRLQTADVAASAFDAFRIDGDVAELAGESRIAEP